MPSVESLASPRAIPPQTKRAHSTVTAQKLARNLPRSFAAVEDPDGELREELAALGLRPFRFMANAQTVERLPGGYYADKFYHVPLTVWAVVESVARSHARAQITRICPVAGSNWTVLPAA